MTYGATGSLKTFLELDKAMWGVMGKPWAASEIRIIEGFKTTRKLRAVIIAGEGARGIKKRVKAWKRRHKITEELALLVIPQMPRFAYESDCRKLVRTIKKLACLVRYGNHFSCSIHINFLNKLSRCNRAP